jgi:hypothetical protein
MAQQKLEYQALLDEEKLTLEDLPMEIRKRINVIRPLIGKFNTNPSPKMKEAIIKADVEIAEMIADHIEKDLPEQNEGNDDDDDDNENKNKNRNSGKGSNNRRNDDDDDSNANGDDDDNRNSNNNRNKAADKAAAEKAAEKAALKVLADKDAADKAAADKAAADKVAAEEKAEADKKAEEKAKDDAKKPITNFGTLDMEKKIVENCEKNNGFISEKDLISIIGKSPEYPKQMVFSITLKKVFLKSLYQLL